MVDQLLGRPRHKEENHETIMLPMIGSIVNTPQIVMAYYRFSDEIVTLLLSAFVRLNNLSITMAE